MSEGITCHSTTRPWYAEVDLTYSDAAAAPARRNYKEYIGICMNCRGEPEFKDKSLVDCPKCKHALVWSGR